MQAITAYVSDYAAWFTCRVEKPSDNAEVPEFQTVDSWMKLNKEITMAPKVAKDEAKRGGNAISVTKVAIGEFDSEWIDDFESAIVEDEISKTAAALAPLKMKPNDMMINAHIRAIREEVNDLTASYIVV